jgi:hypothetical protein
LTFEEIALPIYNSTLNFAGRHAWADIACTIRDDASGAVSRLIGEQFQKQMDFLEMSSAAAGIDYKFLTRFEVLDGGNAAGEAIALETWEIYGCYLKEVNYNNMDYSESAPVTISMVMRFDNANQGQGEGIGNAIGRTIGDVATGVG